MSIGPRPDTVTSDNIRSSRADAGVRLFSPGSPVDLATGAALAVEVPQQTNQSDCGLFLLKFVEYTLFTAPGELRKEQIDNVSYDVVPAKERKPIWSPSGEGFLGESDNDANE